MTPRQVENSWCSYLAVRLRTQRVTRPLIMKIRVETRISHGTSRRKVVCGVLSSVQPPRMPPSSAVMSSGIMVFRDSLSNCRRYALMLATCPGHRATVFVTLAFTGGMPTNSKVGNETKLPPPATALIAPASRAAKNRTVAWKRFMNETAMVTGTPSRGWTMGRRAAPLPVTFGPLSHCCLTRNPPEGAWIQALRGGACGKPA